MYCSPPWIGSTFPQAAGGVGAAVVTRTGAERGVIVFAAPRISYIVTPH